MCSSNQPPVRWHGYVYFPYNTQSYLAQYLGQADVTRLSPEDFTQVAIDYDEALLSGKLYHDEARGNYRVPLTLTTPDGIPLYLCIAPSTRSDGMPWVVSYVSPPAAAKALLGMEEDSHEEEEQSPAFTRLSDRDKQEIYAALLTAHPVGAQIPLTLAASTLARSGTNPQRYGYSRMQGLVVDMPEYLTLCVGENPQGQREFTVTILPAPDGELREPAEDEQPPLAMTERTVNFDQNRQQRFSRLVNGAGKDEPAEPLTEEQLTEFRNSYDDAVAEAPLDYDPDFDCYRFRLTLSTPTGLAIGATLRRSNRAGGQPWYVSSVYPCEEQGIRPGDKLKKFAYLGNTNDFLRSLAEHAEPERWSFSDDEDDYSILWNYITYTFHRLDYEGKVYTDPQNRFAAFNTGLLTRRFGSDLYAYFEPNTKGGSQWRFVCFCSDTNSSRGPLEKHAATQLLAVRGELELPCYFTNLHDTMFDPDSILDSNFIHIVRDNLSRFPMDWLHKQCDDYDRSRSLLAQIEGERARYQSLRDAGASFFELEACRRRQKELFRALGEAVIDESDNDMCDLLMAMKALFDDAVNRTIKRCRRNFKLAIPCYFPTRNLMSMLLPISFTGRVDEAPCMALVAERQKNGVYMGRTVLTMGMAYIDARLLCRPCSEWLDNRRIRMDGPTDLMED